VNEQAAALAKKLGVTPAPNAVSASLQEGAAAAKAKLSPLSGAAFDRAYIAREVEYHQAVLNAIDDLLVPTTENAELKALIRTVRPAIAAHLERARGIHSSLVP
jgi:putative membrane protein